MRRIKTEEQIIKEIFLISEEIRYAALYAGEELFSQQKEDFPDASSSESDRYEELFVNPTVLKITNQRGNLDCGGTDFVLIKYGKFFQLIREINNGHISVCIAPTGDPIKVNTALHTLLIDRQLIDDKK